MNFSSVKVAEWPPFGTELLIRLTECSLCFYLLFLVVSHFDFEGGSVVLIAQFPGHCLHVTFFLIVHCLYFSFALIYIYQSCFLFIYKC